MQAHPSRTCEREVDHNWLFVGRHRKGAVLTNFCQESDHNCTCGRSPLRKCSSDHLPFHKLIQNCTFSMATYEKCSSDHFLGVSWSDIWLHFCTELVRTALFSLVKVIRTALVLKSGQNRSYALFFLGKFQTNDDVDTQQQLKVRHRNHISHTCACADSARGTDVVTYNIQTSERISKSAVP